MVPVEWPLQRPALAGPHCQGTAAMRREDPSLSWLPSMRFRELPCPISPALSITRPCCSAACVAGMTIFVFFLVPETRGVPLEEM